MTALVTPPQLVWKLHGSPAAPECSEGDGRCFVCCGDVVRGQTVQGWLKSSYTDQNRARNPLATHVCEACIYTMSRISPVLGRPAKDGKKFGGNFRNYSHLWEDGWNDSDAFGDSGEQCADYVNASKGQKPLIRKFIERGHRGPWFAALADSGQKHVIPFTPLNGAGRSGLALFDELAIQIPDNTSLIGEMTELLTAGATKDAIETGEYTWGAMSRCARRVMEFERERSGERGGSWFTLAIWLAQRDEEDVAARLEQEKEARKSKDVAAKAAKAAARPRKEANRGTREAKPAGNAGGRGATRSQSGAPSKQRREPAEALGDAGDQSEKRGQAKRDGGRVGDKVAARNDGGKPAQLGFSFGD